MKDEKILKLLKKKDERGLFAVSEKYEKLLVYIASSILGNRTLDIEECVNDTYFKIWTNIEKYDLNKASLKTYLKIIVRNTALNKIRDISKTEFMMHTEDFNEILEDYADYCQNPESKTIERERVTILESILKELNKKDQEIIIRRYFYLQQTKDIAKFMEMSVTAIDSRLSRLRGRIKLEFERREQYE